MVLGVLCAGLLGPASLAYAATAGCNDGDPNTACDVLDKTCAEKPDAAACQNRDQKPDNNAIYGPNGILTKAARLVAILVGIASVIMIMVGGLKYMLANGDSASINNAKNTILYALIGLAVSLVAQGIVIFVINQVLK